VPVARQMKDKNSLYNHYKTFLNLRNTSLALTYGELQSVNLNSAGVCAFIRNHQTESLLVLHNVSGAELSVNIPGNLQAYQQVAFQNNKVQVSSGQIKLPAYSTIILKK
jgi:glycosidase